MALTASPPHRPNSQNKTTMHGNSNARAWKPSLADIDKLIIVARGSHPPTREFSTWLGRIRGALQARPDALNCVRHYCDLRNAGSRLLPIQPSDVRRRADALERARALAAVLPIWPNRPLPEPNENLEKSGTWSKRLHPPRTLDRYKPHRRQLRDSA
jgi:hypothetical protein